MSKRRRFAVFFSFLIDGYRKSTYHLPHPIALSRRVVPTTRRNSMSEEKPLVGIVMGSTSDWPDVMDQSAKVLRDLGIPFEVQVISAHRNTARLQEWIG